MGSPQQLAPSPTPASEEVQRTSVFCLVVLMRELREPQPGRLREGPSYICLGRLGRYPKWKKAQARKNRGKQSMGFTEECCVHSTVVGVQAPRAVRDGKD